MLAEMTLLTPEAIEAMDAGDLIGRAVDVYDYDPLVRAPLLALMRIQAKKLKIATILEGVFKVYEEAEKANSIAALPSASAGIVPLECDARGNPFKTITNFLRVMRGDPFYAGLQYNLLRNTQEIVDGGKIRLWEKTDDARSREFVERAYGIHNEKKHGDALALRFRDRPYHPIRDLIEPVAWDGVERIPTFLHRWMRCEDTDYTREVSRLIFAGGIHRVYQPGCKFDDMAVLIDKQGSGKTTLVKWLAMEDRFYREVTVIEGNKGMEALDGAWVCEVGELLALVRAREQEAIKSYLTRQVDVYRKSYDERISENPRQCIFIGTTNKQQFLTDKTGGRRFYPVQCASDGYWLYGHESEIKAEIVQCWAEALAKMRKGDMPPYANPDLIGKIREQQEGAQEDDYRVGLIAKYLRDKDIVCGIELWEEALDNKPVKPTRRDSMDISEIMQGMDGWTRSQGRPYLPKYGRQRVWERESVLVGNDETDLFPVVGKEEGEDLPF